MRGVRNIVIHGLPSTIEVGGIRYAVNTDFRIGINIARILEDPELREHEAYALAFESLFFGGADRPPLNEKAVAAILLFHAANEFALFDAKKAKQNNRKSERSFCWDYDIPLVVADFQREYGIDLTDSNYEMHWWRFMALFCGLSSDSATNTVRAARTEKIPDKATSDHKQYIVRSKALNALPPRTRAEHVASEKARYGIG